jgi:hypothetical protein
MRLHWIGLGLVLAACDDGDSKDTTGAGGAGGGGQEASEATWHQGVAPLLAEKCVGCHHEGGIAPFVLDDFTQAKALAPLIIDAVESGRMPPWGAQETETCTPRPFKDDLRLKPEELALLKDWQAAGTPEGDAATAAPLPERTLDTLKDATLALTPEVAFATEGMSDQFRCFVLDPQFTEEVYINGTHFIAGNPLVVHHALLFVTEDIEALEEKVDETGSYDCFGAPDGLLVSAWAPGGIPTEFPANAGMPIPAGARFVMQIHYHPTGTSTEEDRTTVQLRLTDGVPEYLAASALIGNFEGPEGEVDGLMPGPGDRGPPEFFVPAGAKGHQEVMRFTVPGELDGRPFPGMFIHSVATHMHYVGTDMQIRLSRNAPVPPCTSAQLDPLQTCMDTHCPGPLSAASVGCAQQNCAAEVEAVDGTCGDCLVAQVTAGAQDAYAPCAAPPPLPTQYGPLAEQPEEECLVQTPAWNFAWQRFYAYDAPIEGLPFVKAGDVFDFKCTYDNSMDNPFVRDALSQQGLSEPRDVVLGEETLDEMCLMALTLLYKWE